MIALSSPIIFYYRPFKWQYNIYFVAGVRGVQLLIHGCSFSPREANAIKRLKALLIKNKELIPSTGTGKEIEKGSISQSETVDSYKSVHMHH